MLEVGRASTVDTIVLLAFSGGGMRSAGFGYGVLKGMRDFPLVVDGHQSRLLDEIDKRLCRTNTGCTAGTLVRDPRVGLSLSIASARHAPAAIPPYNAETLVGNVTNSEGFLRQRR